MPSSLAARSTYLLNMFVSYGELPQRQFRIIFSFSSFLPSLPFSLAKPRGRHNSGLHICMSSCTAVAQPRRFETAIRGRLNRSNRNYEQSCFFFDIFNYLGSWLTATDSHGNMYRSCLMNSNDTRLHTYSRTRDPRHVYGLSLRCTSFYGHHAHVQWLLRGITSFEMSFYCKITTTYSTYRVSSTSMKPRAPTQDTRKS